MGVSILVIVMIVFAVAIPFSYADIGIDISQKCKLMLKNNLTTTCPTLNQIMVLFPDTSPSHQVGDFKIIDGITQRDKPQYDIKNMNTYFRALWLLI